MRQQGENQENQPGHTSGPKTCPETSGDTRVKLETLLQQTAEDTIGMECSRLSSFETWRSEFVDQVQMNIEMSSFEGNQEGDVTKLEEDISAAILAANDKSPGVEISPAQSKQLLDTFLFQFYYLLSQSELNRAIFDPNYVDDDYYDDYYDDDYYEDDSETQTEMNMMDETETQTEMNMMDDTFSLDDIENSDVDEFLEPDFSLGMDDEVTPEVEPEYEPYPEVEPETEPYPEVEPETEPYAEVEPEYEPYPNFSIDVVAEPTAEPTAEPYPEAEPEYEPSAEVEPEYELYPEFSIDVVAEPTAEAEPLPMGEPEPESYKDHSHVDPPMDPCLLHSHSGDTTMAPEMGDEYGAKTSDDMMFSNDPIEPIMDPSLDQDGFLISDNSADDSESWPVSFEDLGSSNPSDMMSDLEVVSVEDPMEDTTTEDSWWSNWFTTTSSSGSVTEIPDMGVDDTSITISMPVPKYVLSSTTQSALSSRTSSTSMRISTTTTLSTTSTTTTTTSTIQSTTKSSGFGSFWQQFYG